MSYQESFENFMSQDFICAVDKSTKASWAGGGYSVELFEDGNYNILWSQNIGNMYVSPGIILPVPPLDDSEWDEDPSVRYYGVSEEILREHFREEVPAYGLSQMPI